MTKDARLPARAALLGGGMWLAQALAVPLAVFVCQAVAFALPGSHWLESDAIILAIALVAFCWGISSLRRGARAG